MGLSLGSKRLAVLPTSLAIKSDGSGNTIVDSGSTIMSLIEAAFTSLNKAVLKTVMLPVANGARRLSILLYVGKRLDMRDVQILPLVLHFLSGAVMILTQDNYFQEPRFGLMCLPTVESSFSMSIIGNDQQQNMHILLDALRSCPHVKPASV